MTLPLKYPESMVDEKEKFLFAIRFSLEFLMRGYLAKVVVGEPGKVIEAVQKMELNDICNLAQFCKEAQSNSEIMKVIQKRILESKDGFHIRRLAIVPGVNVEYLQSVDLDNWDDKSGRYNYSNVDFIVSAWTYIRGHNSKKLTEFVVKHGYPNTMFNLCRDDPQVNRMDAARFVVAKKDLYILLKMVQASMISLQEAEDLVAESEDPGIWYSFAKNFEGINIPRLEKLMFEKGRDPYKSWFRDYIPGANLIRDWQIVAEVMES